jgi:hypothetical protein
MSRERNTAWDSLFSQLLLGKHNGQVRPSPVTRRVTLQWPVCRSERSSPFAARHQLLVNESLKRFAPKRRFPSGREALDDHVEQRPQARQPTQVAMIPNIGIPPWRRLVNIDWHNARDAVAQWPGNTASPLPWRQNSA